MTSSHCHCHMVQVHSSSLVARGEPPLESSLVYLSAVIRRYLVGLEVTPDSGGSACRCRVDDECSSAASRDGSTDYCIWVPDVLSATMEDFPLQALAVSAQFKNQVSFFKRCAVALVFSVMGNWVILVSWSS